MENNNSYDPSIIEKKWQEIWEKTGINKSNQDKKDNYYCLDMFPYPSGSGLHVGHWRGYVLSDVAARIKKIEGYNVLHPMGWDAFGLPAENDAIKKGIHPRLGTDNNIAAIKEQLKKIGACYDWEKEIDTTDPNFYKWTQWMFLQMYKMGLAYEKEMPINWCPSCKTGLANEEVVGGVCERCGAETTKKNIRQWVLKITNYADRLLEDLNKLDWPEKVKKMQSDWIGRSEGTEIEFRIMNHESRIKVFTTRADTLFGCTYVVLAPESDYIKNLESRILNLEEVNAYIESAKKKSNIDRMAEDKEKTGVKIEGVTAINPINGKEVEIWVADYVLADYGTGAVMAVPAHDERDFAFAKKYGIKIIEVIISQNHESKNTNYDLQEAFTNYGYLINSEEFDGLTSEEGKKKITEKLKSEGFGDFVINYKLRDWLFSRQRYWGEPIPIIHCEKCGIQPVDEKDLPVLLPEIEKYEPTGTGESPLANVNEWVNTTCPKCGGAAKREINTMPQWAGSCWYYLAYAIMNNFQFPISDFKDGLKDDRFQKQIKDWLPVDLYVGGVEHAVLHLLYSRFWYKVLYDIGVVDHDEPFNQLFNQGMVYLHGAKMSKSKGNVVSPDEIIEKYGTDALRAYELFMAPPELDAEWNTNGVPGTYRFLKKVWNLGENISERVEHPDFKKLLTESFEIGETELEVATHKTIKKFNEALEGFRYNTLVSTLMEFTNLLQSKKDLLYTYPQPYLVLIILLSPICPHIAEEIWQKFGFEESIFSGNFNWPKHNPEKIKEEMVNIVVQENGKMRGNILAPFEATEEEIIKICNDSPKFVSFCKSPKNVIYVKNRLINFVK
uniref:Leucine--tRNA ligase n=1 Tax=candidate division CPR3 bacterium TaxID=2268181 RepID=A0A7C4R669_UNCC3